MFFFLFFFIVYWLHPEILGEGFELFPGLDIGLRLDGMWYGGE